jgi:hypothetical protein
VNAELQDDEYHVRNKLQLEYHRAAAAIKESRIQVDTWERRERDAKADLRKVVDQFRARGWMIP